MAHKLDPKLTLAQQKKRKKKNWLDKLILKAKNIIK